MNLLYVTQWFSSKGGGGEVVFEDVAKGMAKKGHTVYVISHDLNNHTDDKTRGLFIHRIRPKLYNPPPPSIIQNILFLIFGIIEGAKLIHKNKIELIHSNNFMAVIVGYILSKIFRIPFITTIHVVFDQTPELWDKWSKQEGVSKLSKILGPLLEKVTIKINPEYVHSVSDSTCQDIKKVNKNAKTVLIPNGLYLDRYSKYNSKFENYIVYIGRLVFYKNVQFLISIWPQILEKDPNGKLIIIGEGPFKTDLEKKVIERGLNENIIFKGYVSEDDKLEILSKATALVTPSFTEGLPLVVLEAFALGKPAIMSDIKCSHEMIINDTDGYIIDTNDSEEWINKIAYLLNNKDHAKDLGIKANKKMNTHFNMLLNLDKFESLYKDVIKRKNQI